MRLNNITVGITLSIPRVRLPFLGLNKTHVKSTFLIAMLMLAVVGVAFATFLSPKVFASTEYEYYNY